jgi:hypothetical protein
VTTIDTTTAPFDLKLTGDIVEGLRTLADLIEANPELSEYFRYSDAFRKIMLPVSHYDDPRAAMAEWARAGKASGHPVTKDYNGQWGSVTVTLSDAVKIWAYAEREKVCTRIVTGTETVTVTVPDPDVIVPTVEVEQTREIVEWQCLPLLAEPAVTE